MEDYGVDRTGVGLQAQVSPLQVQKIEKNDVGIKLSPYLTARTSGLSGATSCSKYRSRCRFLAGCSSKRGQIICVVRYAGQLWMDGGLAGMQTNIQLCELQAASRNRSRKSLVAELWQSSAAV